MEKKKATSQVPIGSVSPGERDLIQALYLKKQGLGELFVSISRISDDDVKASRLYERLVEDMSTVAEEFQQWWDGMSKKYEWPRREDTTLRIDFDSCAIYEE